MPVSVTMPRLGESVTEGTVTRWLKQEGDRVEVDEPLLEVSTDKVDTEIPSPAAGVLARIVVRQDETAEVGSELAVIAGDGEPNGAAAPAATARAVPAEHIEVPAPSTPQPPSPQPARPATPAGSPPVPPSAPAGPPSGPTTAVTMPALGESVTEGTVTRWLKEVGQPVQVDEPLLEVSTDKVDTEIPAPAGGVLLEIRVDQDQTAEVGAVLAVIGQPTAAAVPPSTPLAAPPAPAPAPAAPAPAAPAAAAPAPAAPAAAAPAPARPASAAEAPPLAEEPGYVTPLVRKLAAEHGVDLSRLAGTGVGGRIRRQDVLDAATASAAGRATRAPVTPDAAKPAGAGAVVAALRGRTEKMSRMRALIAKRMVESLQTSAQLTTVAEVDVTKIAKLRDQAKASFLSTHGVKLTFLPFFAVAAVEALRAHPVVNASIDMEAGTITYHDAEHLGVAVDTERGLMVPVIHHAGDLNLAGLAKRINDLAERTRTNKITPDELAGGTFTLTNTGSRGALFDTPIINQPQVAILGTGAVVKRAMVVDDPELGEIIAPRSVVYLAISYDHRLIDGADAARFLSAMKDRLQEGNFEAELGL